MSNKTFIKITNQDIYNKLIDIEKRLGRINVKVNVNSAVTALVILIIICILSGIIR